MGRPPQWWIWPDPTTSTVAGIISRWAVLGDPFPFKKTIAGPRSAWKPAHLYCRTDGLRLVLRPHRLEFEMPAGGAQLLRALGQAVERVPFDSTKRDHALAQPHRYAARTMRPPSQARWRGR